MKKYALLVGIVLLVAWLPMLVAFQWPGFSYYMQRVVITKPEVAWRAVGSITEPNTTLAVGDRTWDAIVDATDPNWLVIENLPPDAKNIQLRFRTDADDDDDVVEVWYCASEYVTGTAYYDSFTLGTTLTIKGGKQTTAQADVFVDTCTAVDAGLISVISDSAGDRIVTVTIGLGGAKALAFVATTLETSSTLSIEARY